jgi:3-hydroxyisobutyrate dehydrogenase
MTKPRVAILGLGIMGGGMAGRLLASGFPLSVYNRSREKAEAFGKNGARVSSSPREAASQADVVLSMVADDNASRAMWLGEYGALAGASGGALLIESSTLTVSWIKVLAKAAADKGCEFLDAPVTGTKPHAASGELTFLVGGSAATLDAARPVLAVLSKAIIHFGPTGSGAAMKLINNFVCAVQAASFAEGVSLIDASGLDRTKAIALLLAGAPGSPLAKRIAEKAGSGDFSPNFELRLMAKDIRYAQEQASRCEIPLQTAVPALKIFEDAVQKGYGDEDMSAVIKSLERK